MKKPEFIPAIAPRILLSGGGTGGHVFPAIAIADALRHLAPEAEILFVGALGKLEMEKVPQAGYTIKGLWISGFQRSLSLRNLLFPFKLVHSIWKSRQIIREFKPDVVVGVGGYASGPVLRVATRMGIPALIQEQNAFAGVTNRILASKVQKICVAYSGMDRFFPASKTILTGNPVRKNLFEQSVDKDAAAQHFGLNPNLPTILIVGGSLGALAINEAMEGSAANLLSNPRVQVLWQAGKTHFERFAATATAALPNVKILPFIDRMELAYALADVVVSRAGAIAISELCMVGKPAILIPSPFVAEDHQSKNAMALAAQHAAIFISNNEAGARMIPEALELLQNDQRRQLLSQHIQRLALPNAAEDIARELLALIPGFALSEPRNPENLHQIRSIYFVGIGGIGMSALARYFRQRGVRVTGYDKTETALTRNLVKEGMDIHYEDAPESIPHDVDLAVFTPAIPADLSELQTLKSRGIPLKKRAEVLGIISRGMKTIAIAGTHGKTTTSSLTTWLLKSGGVDCSAFLGGIVRNFGSNYVGGTSEWVVVEADEYDRSFLQLNPDVAVILSMDADHLDIYGDADSIVETGYKAFADRLKQGGQLFVQHRWGHYFPGVSTFGIDDGAVRAEQVRVEDGFFTFNYRAGDLLWENLQLAIPGRHNVENAVAAITAARKAGVQEDGIRKGLASFAGIQRRFEIIHKDPNVVYVDDYAHHPSELEAVIGAAREFFPGKKLTGIFQPHLYSRTRDFAPGFAKALDLLDEIILLDIYPAREQPIPGVSRDTIADLITHQNLIRASKSNVLELLKNLHLEVLLTLGAGDIDTLVEPIHHWLSAQTLKNQVS